MIDKIKLNLFQLKAKKDLIGVRDAFNNSIGCWFDNNGNPNEQYFDAICCPLCGEHDSDHAFQIDNFIYVECSDCGAIYTNPHVKEGVLTDLYSGGAYKKYQSDLVNKGKKIRSSILEDRKFKQVDQLSAVGKGSLLDVGCGNASFLNVCKEQGWSVQGVDPTKESANDALTNYGILVHEGEFSAIDTHDMFDVITFWGVLEHLRDPVEALRRAVKLLKPNGLIVFEVPSADCFLSKYLHKYPFEAARYIESGRHNLFFSKKAIDQLAKKFNLSLAYIESNGLDVQTILMEEFGGEITEKILNIQDVMNDLLIGDHYRVFLKNWS